MTIETITFIGVILTFLATVIGWVITYQSQKRLIRLQEQFTSDRESRQHTPPDKMEFPNKVKEWFNQGLKLAIRARTLLGVQSLPGDKKDYADEKKALELNHDAWQEQQAQSFIMAKSYDPKYQPGQYWILGSPALPSDLPNLIMAFGFYVSVSVQALSQEINMEQPSEDKITSLYRAGMDATERVKRFLNTNSNQEA
jgi:ribosomal protein S16